MQFSANRTGRIPWRSCSALHEVEGMTEVIVFVKSALAAVLIVTAITWLRLTFRITWR